MADFTGKVGLIVGVANHRSLAWAIAQATSKGGANLVLTYQSRFEEHVGELAETLTPKAMVLPLDVTSDDEIRAETRHFLQERTFARKRADADLETGALRIRRAQYPGPHDLASTRRGSSISAGKCLLHIDRLGHRSKFG